MAGYRGFVKLRVYPSDGGASRRRGGNQAQGGVRWPAEGSGGCVVRWAAAVRRAVGKATNKCTPPETPRMGVPSDGSVEHSGAVRRGCARDDRIIDRKNRLKARRFDEPGGFTNCMPPINLNFVWLSTTPIPMHCGTAENQSCAPVCISLVRIAFSKQTIDYTRVHQTTLEVQPQSSN